MMLSGISVPLLGFVDTAVMGHLDDPSWMGAVAIGSAIFTMLFMSMNFLRMGTTGITAQALGANDASDIKTGLSQSIIIAIVLALLLIALQKPLLEIALRVLSPDPVISKATAQYFLVRIWGAPATLLNFVLIGWFLGLQKARIALLISLLINTSNIILDLIFVPLVGWDIDGVAWATVIAEYSGLALALMFAHEELTKYNEIFNRSKLFNIYAYKHLFDINANLFLRTLALMFILTFLTAQSARFGELILAANAILLNLQLFLSYVLDGIAHAGESLSGKAYGSQDKGAIRQVAHRTFIWAVVAASICSVFYFIAGPTIIGLVTTIDPVKSTAINYLPWIIISPLVSVWCFIFDGIFVGLTRAREMRTVMIMSMTLVFLPTWYLSISLGNHGLWLAFTAFMAARGIGMFLYWRNISSNR
jgi:multidrug resistance protein, MATE family